MKKKLSEAKKLVKSTEKENYNLQKRIDNLLETLKTQKENVTELKKEKSSAERNVKSREERNKD